MDFVKVQLSRLQEQISQLTASQKMLTAALLAIMVMTIVWWGKISGTPEMEPVIDQDLSLDDMARIKAAISAHNVSYQVSGTRILVPADRKLELLADLSYEQLLPSNSQSAWDEIISKMDGPFNSQSKDDAMWNKIKEATLAQVIGNFPHVGRAMVILDTRQQRGFGDNNIAPSASVNITLRSGDRFDKKLVDAAADLVAGACAGMHRDRVKVIVDGVSHTVQEADDGGSTDNDWMDQVQKSEKYFSDKIRQQLAFIGDDVMASVTVQPVIASKIINTVTYDKNGVVQKENSIKSTDQESTNGAHSGGEPGTGANVSAQVDDGSSAANSGTSQTNSTNETTFQLFPSKQEERTSAPAGALPPVAAAVRIPRSYFVRIAKIKFPDLKGEPTDAVLDPIIAEEMPKIRSEVKNCTNLKDDSSVSVADYIDTPPMSTGTTQAAASPMSLAMGGHLKEIVLGAMAMISLFLVSMMVKKAGPSPAAIEAAAAVVAEQKASAKVLTVEELAGEVGEGNASLDGVELDEETIRSKQVLDQVSAMVKENPEGAATLVKRWLARA